MKYFVASDGRSPRMSGMSSVVGSGVEPDRFIASKGVRERSEGEPFLLNPPLDKYILTR